jgi:hypothetical protein
MVCWVRAGTILAAQERTRARVEMAQLKQLADRGNDDAPGGPLIDLPKALVDAVLALPPMGRASLAALIAGSLADEVHHAHSVIDELVAATRAPPRRPGVRKRTRS